MNTEKLRNDLQAVVCDTEEILKATASQTGEVVEKARARAQQTLREAKCSLAATAQDIGSGAREAAGQVAAKVQGHPLKSLGVAAGIGVLIGLLMGRR